MALAAAIAAAKAGNRLKSAADPAGDLAFQVKAGNSDNCILPGGKGQEVIDVPAPGIFSAAHDLAVSFHPREAARPPGRAGVGVVTLGEFETAQSSHFDISIPVQPQD